MKFSSLCALLFVATVLATPTHAQNPTRVVLVASSPKTNDFEAQVVSALKARIGAATRYIFGDESVSELRLTVACLEMTQNIRGGVCSYTVAYWPNELAGLSQPLGRLVLLSDSEPTRIGEQLFENFVEVSAENELAKHLVSMRRAVAFYEASKAKSKP